MAKKITGEHEESLIFPVGAKSGLPKGIVWGVVGLIMLFAGSFGYFLYRSATVSVKSSMNASLLQLQAGVKDLRNFDPQSAAQEFQAAGAAGPNFGGILSEFKPLFKSAGDLAGGFGRLADLGVKLSAEASFFESAALPDFLGGNGADLIAHLSSTSALLGQAADESDILSADASNLGISASGSAASFGSQYLSLRIGVAGAQKFLSALTDWFSSPDPRHVLVLLENPSEMRPGGGFLGSYADAVIQGGSLLSTDVRDIADADLAFKPTIIPPVPLMPEITRMRPADANWFFGFPETASETISFMERSDLYAASSTSFDAAIAVSTKVIGDLLSLTGPITIPGVKTPLDAANFLEMLQAKVQQGQATNASYPKMALRDLAAALTQKFSSMDDAAKQKLFTLAEDWFAKRDVEIYFKDPVLEQALGEYGLSDGVYATPADFEGDYLALADANINGGKSDLFIKQSVLLQSQINASGTVTDHLVIDRTHTASRSNAWWYDTPNQNYLQVFIPDASELLNETGAAAKSIYPPAYYAKQGYSTDPLVAALESSTAPIFNYPAILSHEEDGKEVLSTWSRINPGGKTELVLDYSHRLYSQVADGTSYRFVFEKQPGSERSYTFDVSAPPGFKFAENNLPVYEYQSDDPPGRLVIDLTLEKE
ncbi:MAG TPA: DUF4012 domain-containing protein [Candidatus Paceibacterota bacterium]|nr:DUF4012 domain-containing protein [Candidatus Paceibacterota bacterium]